MKKINVKLLVLTSSLTLLPMLVGLFLWKELPDTLPSHFGFDGTVDGYSSKVEAVFMIPALMMGVHILAVVLTSLDPKARNVTPKVGTFIYWIIPLISGLVQLSIYGSVMGWIHNSTRLGLIFIGALFLILGNYLPKIKQNYTVGIKLPWTLHDEENWNKTHRLAGKLWVIGGFIILISELLGLTQPFVFFATIVIMVFFPIIYSIVLAKSKSSQV